MMGFAWVDLNGDGLPDLVGGGQHSQLFYGLMTKSGNGYAFTTTGWFDQADEYLGVSSLRKNHYAFPCVYVHIEIESGRSPKGDYITCFDKASKTWTKQALPATTTTGEKITRFEKMTTNTKMDDVGEVRLEELRLRDHPLHQPWDRRGAFRALTTPESNILVPLRRLRPPRRANETG